MGTPVLHQLKNCFWKNIDLNVKIGKTVIIKTNSYKYLGTIIDRNLTWLDHIDTIKTKFEKTLGVLYKTRHFLNEKHYIWSLNVCWWAMLDMACCAWKNKIKNV